MSKFIKEAPVRRDFSHVQWSPSAFEVLDEAIEAILNIAQNLADSAGFKRIDELLMKRAIYEYQEGTRDEYIEPEQPKGSGRERVLRRDGRKCVVCSSMEMLQVHHINPRSNGGDEQFDNLITLCKECHIKVHKRIIREKRILMIKGEIKDYPKITKFMTRSFGDTPASLEPPGMGRGQSPAPTSGDVNSS